MLARAIVAFSGHRAQLPAVLSSLMHFLNRARRRQSNYCLEGTSRVNNRFPFSLQVSSPEVAPWSGPVYFQTVPHNLAQYAFYFMIKGAYLDCICTALAQRVSDFHDNFNAAHQHSTHSAQIWAPGFGTSKDHKRGMCYFKVEHLQIG